MARKQPVVQTVPMMVIGFLALVGCANQRGTFLGLDTPKLQSPGTFEYQRNRANLFDPYSDQDRGPAVVGGRPRYFDKPAPEPVRNRWLADSWWSR